MAEGKRVLRQAFRRLEEEVPERLGRALRWLRHPHSRWVRIPAGLLLIVGGLFSFLPGLGIWMLPLGLLLLALDVPFLRKPMGRSTIWGADRWATGRAWVRQRWRREPGAAPQSPLAGDGQKPRSDATYGR